VVGWNLKKCREEGTFPGFDITEIDVLLKAKETMDKVNLNLKLVFESLRTWKFRMS